MSSGPKNSRPPAPAATAVVPFGYDYSQVPPDTAPNTIAIAITKKMRKAVLLSGSIHDPPAARKAQGLNTFRTGPKSLPSRRRELLCDLRSRQITRTDGRLLSGITGAASTAERDRKVATSACRPRRIAEYVLHVRGLFAVPEWSELPVLLSVGVCATGFGTGAKYP
jgi:hypothetical protein